MRLGLDEIGVTELMGVTEHARATATAAGALGLDTDARLLVSPVDPESAEAPVGGSEQLEQRRSCAYKPRSPS